jgi:hypothetical protein
VLEVPQLDPGDYHRDVLPGLTAGRNGQLAAAAIGDTPPLATKVGDGAWTYRRDGDQIAVTAGVADDAAVVLELTPEAWSDLVQLVRTVPALMISGDIGVSGPGPAVDRWERALRALWQGMPVVDPVADTLVDRSGAPLDIGRSFTLADSDEELAWFLRTVGVMRVREVFTAAEIASLNAEVDRLVPQARPDDDRSWWVDTEDGSQVVCRLVYASEQSAPIAALATDPRLRRLAHLVSTDLQPSLDRMEGIGVLLKPPGKVRGLANIPWHTDCGLGGHLVLCPSVAVGVQLTAATRETGCFEAIAGTHGASCRVPTPDEVDEWPHLFVPTEPGDVTVHIADLLHASPRPTGQGGRRTIYVTFHPPALFEHVGPGEAYNDAIRRRSAADVAAAVRRR